MDLINAWTYLLGHFDEFGGALRTHLLLSGLGLGIALIVCVPLGLLTSRWGAGARIILNIVGVLRVVPSIAILFLLLPTLGLGFTSALVALTLLAGPPLLINTDTGMRGVDPAVLEAGRGLGMGPARLLREVQVPLALPVIVAGLRAGTVEVIASATLAQLVGAGGLGIYIFRGLALNRNDILLVGAIPVAVLALSAELLLSFWQRRVTPP